MPFVLADLDRISARVGMRDKTLREMSDTQFTAWLRANGASGLIGVVATAPGHLEIPIEERVRALNDLEARGFYIAGVMGSAPTTDSRVDPQALERAAQQLEVAATALQDVAGALSTMGELDTRVNTRASIHGAIELVDLLRGAVQHARRDRGRSPD